MNVLAYKLLRVWPKLKEKFYVRWNRIKFRMLGIEYGRNMRVFNHVYIEGHGKIKIGDNLRFRSGDGLNPIARNIRGEMFVKLGGVISIGNNVGISSASLRAGTRISIGNNVNIGADCLLIDTDAHPADYMQRRYEYRRSMSDSEYMKLIPAAPITVEDDVWIGTRCIVLKGVTIGARSIIAAGSVVTKDIPADVVAGGVPCRVIRKLL